MAGYIRNDTPDNIATGNVIRAADLDGEYDAVEAAFNATTGHTHDGTAAEGGPVSVIGPAQDTVATSSALRPKTDNVYDLGTPVYEWKDLYIDGTAYIDNLEADTVTMTSGTLDNVVIGGTSPAAADFTTLTATSVGIDGGAINGTVIGGVTPADGTFDNLTVDGNLIVSGGVDISPSAHILPTTDDAYDLGSSGFEFRDLYIDGIAYVDDLRADTVNIDGGTIDGVTIATGTFSGNLLGATVSSLSAPLSVAYGGTGVSDLGSLQSLLNLNTMAYQSAGNVAITGGSISGVTISGYATTAYVTGQGYATESWVTTRGYITSSALSGYATESWVTTRGYATTSYVTSALSNYATTSSLSNYIPTSDYSDFVNVNGDTMSGDLQVGNYILLDASTGYITLSGTAPRIYLSETDTGALIRLYASSDLFRCYDDDGAQHMFYSRRTTGDFYAYGNVTAYSDARLKDNIETIEGGLEKVSKLRGVSYERFDRRNIGLIAQEVMEVVPEVVLEGDDGYYTVCYGNLVGLLVEAVKELKKEVEELKNANSQ